MAMMRILVFSSLCLFFISLCRQRVLSETQSLRESGHASFPPRGWNSYDSFCWTISEEEFLQNAELVSRRLRAHGYEFVVVDFLWYRRKVKGAYTDSLGFDVIDEWGRMIPDPGRWPSSRDGKGFTKVAKIVHSMGLKFGIHVMRGISTQAVNANTPILDITKGSAYEEAGRYWYAKDIGIKERACAWMPHGFMSVNTKLGAGRAFLRSLYQQYADWGVDFVKHDCVFGDDLDINEIRTVSEILRELDHPILYSLSPGTSATPAMAKDVHHLVNMYRITGDDWDKWADVAAHFDVTRDFSNANMIGAEGLLGKSWPDLDMLPLGWLTDAGSNEGPHRYCNLNLNERKTLMTLWSMAKSPLMFGGDMRRLDVSTFHIITNPTLLEINLFSSNNKEFPFLGAKGLRFKNRGLLSQSRSLRNKNAPEHFLGLTSCIDSKAKGWSIQAPEDEVEQVCWNERSRSIYKTPFCLYKRDLHVELDKDISYKQQYQGKFHILATDTMEVCLDASPKQKLTTKEFKRGSFSPCRRDANQMWEFNCNGTLISSYSGLCAMIDRVKADGGYGGTRSWVATGRRGRWDGLMKEHLAFLSKDGEIYLAVFNLNPEKTLISAMMSDLAKVIPARNLSQVSCTGNEIWSGKHFGEVKHSISIVVESHGCALFVLICQ